MRQWFLDLDRVLRGDATRIAALRRGSLELPVAGIAVLTVVLGMAYGLCMGFYPLFRAGGPHWVQVLAAVVKVPLLFWLTLVVTFPSLYVFNALVGSRLTPISVLRLLVAAIAVMLAVLASLGTIVAFFAVSTTSYAFMILLNVAVCTIAGVLGERFLLQTLHRLSAATAPDPAPIAPSAMIEFELGTDAPGSPSAQDAATGSPGPLPVLPPRPTAMLAPATGALDHAGGGEISRDVRSVFRTWLIVFGLVGAQMAWVLRPFLGAPDRPFSWFRGRESNFFEAVLRALGVY